MSGMETKYSLTVKNNSKNYGNICIFQTLPNQQDNMRSLAWFCKAAHPDAEVEFNWETQYSFIWSEEGELKPGIIFKASQALGADPSDITKIFMTETESLSEEDCEEVSVEPGANSIYCAHPKYYVVFGDFKEGDPIDAAMFENAVELELDGEGKTIVINKDNSINIE